MSKIGMTKERYEHVRDNIHTLELDLENGKILNREANSLSNGYPQIGLAGKKIYHHQIFAVARWGEKCIGMTINHINEVKHDNSWNNLELLTIADNNRAKSNVYGFCHAKQLIEATNLDTGEVLLFVSQSEAARRLGLHSKNISKVVLGKREHTGRYKFKRAI